MSRLASFAVGACAAALSGCPGVLPAEFVDGDGGVIPPRDAAMVLAVTCGTAGCHDASPQAQGGLDLISPDVESRVVDVNAVGIGCESDVLVVPGDPDGSYLLDKVLDVPGICGLPMPFVGVIADSDVQILRQWIIDLAGSAGATLDGG